MVILQEFQVSFCFVLQRLDTSTWRGGKGDWRRPHQMDLSTLPYNMYVQQHNPLILLMS